MMPGAKGSLLPATIFYYGHIEEKYSIKACRKMGKLLIERIIIALQVFYISRKP